MTNNYDNYGYENDDGQERSAFIRRLLIVLMVICAIILIIILIKGCSKKSNNSSNKKAFDYEGTLLDGGKKYFDYNSDKYPRNAGECEEIELQALIERDYVKAADFSKCNTSNTYVKVCKLENGSYHFYPWLVCADKTSSTEYGSETIGSYMDVVPNKTVVSFKFMPQKYEAGDAILGKTEEVWKDEINYTAYKTISSTTYYRYRDQLYKWTLQKNKYYTSKGEVSNAKDVKEYYATSPSSSYTLKDSKAEGYKWYTASATKVYAVDAKGTKLFSHAEISGYPYNENPVCVEYQTRTETGTTSAYHYYKCSKSKNSTDIKYQYNVACGKGVQPEYSYQLDEFYTCGFGQYGEIESKRVGNANTQCKTYSEWKNSTKACDTSLETCRKIEPYCVYNWYRVNTTNRKYIPSNSTSASGEKIYYTSSPKNGAIKDTDTKTTVYKWYRAVTTTTSDYTALPPSGYDGATRGTDYKLSEWSSYSTKNPKVSDGRIREIEKRVKLKVQEIKGTTDNGWSDLTSEYLTENELIAFLKSKNYDVNTLDDIAYNGDLKLKIQMLVRNKKESK